MKAKILIAATMALNAIEEHLLGADIDWYDVARVLKEALDENINDDMDDIIRKKEESEHWKKAQR